MAYKAKEELLEYDPRENDDVPVVLWL